MLRDNDLGSELSPTSHQRQRFLFCFYLVSYYCIRSLSSLLKLISLARVSLHTMTPATRTCGRAAATQIHHYLKIRMDDISVFCFNFKLQFSVTADFICLCMNTRGSAFVEDTSSYFTHIKNNPAG